MRHSVAAILVLAGLSVTGCAPPAGLVGAPGVRVVSSEAEVAGCRPVRIHTRTPGIYGPVAGEQALEYARNAVLGAAAEEGATDLLFEEGGPNQTAYIVRARSYDCRSMSVGRV